MPELDRDDCFIILGCGGSGLNTILRCNELLANDRELRPHLRKLVFYIVADTALDELAAFERGIRDQMGGATSLAPLVHKIALSEGNFTTLPPLIKPGPVNQSMGVLYEPDDKLSPEQKRAKGRIMTHWWTAAADAPFKMRGPFDGRKVPDIVKGASQCPMASYFLAWLRMAKIRAGLEDFVTHQMIPARVGWPRPLQRAGLYVATSMAGGTGRGCWMPIAFGLRDLLVRQGLTCNPVGFFFDAKAFSREKSAKTWLAMRINSLTGMSELSSWIRNVGDNVRSEIYSYWLPSLGERAHDEDSDVLRIALETTPNEGAPVNNALIVFDKSRAASLGSCRQAYDMVGAGIYARIAKWIIGNREVNENFPYNGLGTATFEVPIDQLRRYYEHESRLSTVDTILRPAEPAVIQAAVRLLLGHAGANLYSGERERELFLRRKDGTLIQRVFYALVEQYEPSIRAADEKGTKDPLFEKDNGAEVKKRVKAILAEDRDKVQAAVEQVLFAGGRNPIKTIREALANALLRDSLDNLTTEPDLREDLRAFLLERNGGLPLSAAQLVGILDSIVTCWRQGLQVLPKAGVSPEKMMRDHEKEPPEEMIDRHSDRDLETGFLWIFTKTEKAEVREIVRDAIPYYNYAMVRKVLQALFTKYISELEGILTNARIVLQELDGVRTRFDHELHCMATGEYQPADPKDTLFMNPDRPEDAIKGRGDQEIFYRRQLWPRYVALPAGGNRMPQPLFDLIQEYVRSPDRLPEDDATRADVKDKLEKLIRSGATVPREFLVQNFSVVKVIGGLASVWTNRLAQVQGDENTLYVLLDKFESFFGARPVEENGRYRISADATRFLANMAGCLLANCRPYWDLREAGSLGEDPRVYLFLPISGAEWDRSSKELNAQIAQRAGLEATDVEILVGNNQRDNPFVVLAYTSYGVGEIDKIQSLDYWRGDAEVREWLEKAEDPSGASIFGESTSPAWINKGLGFVDPIYVKEKQLQSRWRPWVKVVEGRDQTLVRTEQTLDAMLYALTTPKDELAKQLEAKGWQLPLLSLRPNQRYVFARRIYELADGKPLECLCPWRKDQEAAIRISRLFAELHAQEIKEDTVVTWIEAILGELELFWKNIAEEFDFRRPGSAPYRRFWQSVIDDLQQQREAADETDVSIIEQLQQRAYAHRDAKK